MIRVGQIKCQFQGTYEIEKEVLRKKAARILGITPAEIGDVQIVKHSIDARKKPDLYVVYTVDISLAEDEGKGGLTPREEAVLNRCKDRNVSVSNKVAYHFPEGKPKEKATRPVIIGMGPAGLFCGYLLAQHGYRPLLLERGADVEQRSADVEAFWEERAALNTESNVQFGEGGAGTFSDGKLNTLVKDKEGRNHYVLETFVKEGAPERILYEAKPHIGTDILKTVVKNMRNHIIEWGGEVRFHSKVTDFIIKDDALQGVVVNGSEEIMANQVVLAIGHSARDTFQVLYDRHISMEAKSFAVGFRVEHTQEMIDASQYGKENVGKLPAASYKLTAQTKNDRGVYSFCMCPGGFVVNASSEEGKLAVNGMSYSKRDSKNANSAIIVAVTPKDFGSDHPLAGLAFQRKLEERAYEAGKGRIPVQCFADFEHNTLERKDVVDSKMTPCTKGMYTYANLRGILPQECEESFIEGMHKFDRTIKGYGADTTLLSGVESRTSSPVRIHRDDTLQNIKGLYPCGEGAGFAGGITSAAMDGCKVAEEIAKASN